MKPNIVLITIDCWRGDHIGTADKPKVQTPNLERLAQQCYQFNNAYTCGGWTKLAMTSLFSSTFPSMYDFCFGKFSEERPFMVDQFRDNGFKTAGFCTNLACGSSVGFGRSFDEFEDLRPESVAGEFKWRDQRGFSRIATKPLFSNIFARLGEGSKPSYPTMDADQLVEKAIDWLDQPHKQPFFLWLHFMDLHWPYHSSQRQLTGAEFAEQWFDRQEWSEVKATQGKYFPGEARAARWRQIYAEETVTLDSHLGTLFSTLKARSDWDNTALCVTSDHGEEMYENGTWAHSWNQLRPEGTHVPLLIKAPKQVATQHVNRIVSHIDIAPTLLNLANIDIPEAMLGQSLFDENPQERPIISEMHSHAGSYGYRLAIRHNGYLYLYDADANRCQLFETAGSEDLRLHDDIYRTDCIVSRHFDQLRLAHISKGLLNVLKGDVVELQMDDTSFFANDDPVVNERLRALGYVD